MFIVILYNIFFNLSLELKKIIKKTQAYEKEQILKSAKEKGLCLEVLNEGECTQSYLVKNVEYVLELIENEKIKCTSKMGNKFGLAYKTYTFEDLLIIENLNKKDYYYTVISKDEIINLNNYESDFESLQSFLDKFIEVEKD